MYVRAGGNDTTLLVFVGEEGGDEHVVEMDASSAQHWQNISHQVAVRTVRGAFPPSSAVHLLDGTFLEFAPKFLGALGHYLMDNLHVVSHLRD